MTRAYKNKQLNLSQWYIPSSFKKKRKKIRRAKEKNALRAGRLIPYFGNVAFPIIGIIIGK